MREVKINLKTEGGIALIINGIGGETPEAYQDHPQVYTKEAKELGLVDLNGVIPPNCKVVLLNGSIPPTTFQRVCILLKQRGILYLTRTSNSAVATTLNSFFEDVAPLSVRAGKKQVAPGKIKEFVTAQANFTASAAEEARRLLPIAQELGINTTVGSISQCILVQRRKKGISGQPKSIQSPQIVALHTLDTSIKGLTDLRDFVEKVERENADLKARLERMTTALKGLTGD